MSWDPDTASPCQNPQRVLLKEVKLHTIYAASRPTVSVLRSRTADEEVIGLDVAVNEVLLVNGLHSADL